MRVRIDAERCQGHGRCYGVAPEVFGADEEGFGRVLSESVPTDWEERAALAERNCPEGAVTVEQDIG